MALLQKKFIAANAVDGSKIRLSNAEFLKARNAADSGDINILKVNASDRVEFASVPQVASDASAGNDLVRLSQVNTIVGDNINGVKPKQAVRAASVGANVVIASALENGDSLDGVTLATGNRVLLKDQTAPEENGIYIVAASGAASRAADFDSISPINEINGASVVVQEGTNAGKQFVQQGTVATVGTDPIVFVFYNSTGTLVAGDGIDITGSTVSVALATDPGLEFSSTDLRVKVDAAGAISRSASGLAVVLEASNPSLQIATNELGIKLFSGGAIVKSASGVGVNLEASNPTLKIASNELGIKLDAAGAIITGASGIKSQVDAATVKINGSNQLESLKSHSESFTLSAGDITNQYLDLAKVAHGASASDNSVMLAVSGAPRQTKTVDYTIALTGGAGGVTRVTLAGDLATAGAAALVAGDIVEIEYSFLT